MMTLQNDDVDNNDKENVDDDNDNGRETTDFDQISTFN